MTFFLKICNFFIVRVPVHGQSLIKHFFVDDILTDKNITIAANENGTEWKPTPKNETEGNQEGLGVTEECTGTPLLKQFSNNTVF